MMNLSKMFDPFAPSKIYGAPLVLGSSSPKLPQTVFCGKLPPLRYTKVEKLYWQNDIDGVNNFIENAMKRTDCVPDSIHFTDDSFLLGVMGINVFAKPYEVVEISSISEHDVFFGIDEDGDLVRAEVGQ